MLTVVLQLLNPCRLVEVQDPVDQLQGPVDQPQGPVDQLQGPVDMVDQLQDQVEQPVDLVDQLLLLLDQQRQDLVVDHLVAEALVGEDAGGVVVEQDLIHP